jgi:hypothetical protein
VGWIVAAVLGGALIGAEPDVVPALVVGTVGVAAILLVVPLAFRDAQPPLSASFVLTWTLVAFVVRAVLGLIIASWPSAVNFLGPDAIGYQREALGLLSAWHGTGLAPALSPGKGGFSIMLAGLYWLTGPHTSGGVMLNAFLGAALVPVLADTTYRAAGARAARYACPLVALLPAFALWSSELLREAGVCLLMGIMLACAVRLADRVTARRVFVGTLAAAGLLTFRASVAIVYIPTLALGVIIAARHPRRSRSRAAHNLALLVLSAISIWMVVLMYQGGFQADLRDIENYRSAVSSGAESGFGAGGDVSTPGAAASFLPVGILRLLLGPFPWDLRSASQALGLVAAVTSSVLLFWFLRGARGWKARRGQPTSPGQSVFLIPGCALTVLLALVSGNYGLAIRERSQILLVVVPIICLGIARARERASFAQAPDARRGDRWVRTRIGYL